MALQCCQAQRDQVRRKEEKNALINTKHPGINYLFGIATMSHLKYESATPLFPS
ncbi:MAG: hypothetical protein WAJ93_18665 [Candidatus Nitrosopolaris sp.]